MKEMKRGTLGSRSGGGFYLSLFSLPPSTSVAGEQFHLPARDGSAVPASESEFINHPLVKVALSEVNRIL